MLELILKTPKEMTMKDTDIEKFLLKNKIYPNLKGYEYFLQAVKLRNEYLYTTMNIYTQLAKDNNISINSVIRSMNYCLMKCKQKVLIEYGFVDKPSTSAVIAYFSNKKGEN